MKKLLVEDLVRTLHICLLLLHFLDGLLGFVELVGEFHNGGAAAAKDLVDSLGSSQRNLLRTDAPVLRLYVGHCFFEHLLHLAVALPFIFELRT